MLANNIVVLSFSQKQREKQNAVHIPRIIAINYQICYYRRRTKYEQSFCHTGFSNNRSQYNIKIIPGT
jgi:hypothetical protein